MVTHTIDFVGKNNAVKNVTVNGKIQPMQTISSDTKRISFQTEEKEAKVVMYETHQYTGKGWFWWWLFCYFISFFGIFDVKQKRACQVTHLNFVINSPTDSYTVVSLNDIKNSDRVAEISSSCQVNELANEQYYDKSAKKTRRLMNLLKFFLTMTALVVLVKYLINT